MKQFDLDSIIVSLADVPDTPERKQRKPKKPKYTHESTGEDFEKSEKKERRSRKPKRTCTEAAIDVLARRNVSEAMMVEKLTAKKYSDEDIAATIARLYEMEYLDDEKYLKGRIEYRRNVSGWGWMRIERELKQQGLCRDLIEEASYALEEEEVGEDDRAYELLARWMSRKTDGALPEDYTEKQKIKDKALRFLLARGFNYQNAKKAWETYEETLKE
ncbi:MAG: regulatory protein RecX [Alphaproteobacteria bacterium]|nr:regulatory protein RecX [Alphaproteobacteria bacterium]